MNRLGLRSLALLLIWILLLGGVVALHRMAPSVSNALAAAPWQLRVVAPEGLTLPYAARTLPHVWRAEGLPLERLQYQAAAVLEEPPTQPWAVYLPSQSLHAEVRVNGHRLGSGEGMEAPYHRNRYKPLLFEVPAALLVAGDNRITVEVAAFPPGSGFLQAVHFAPLAQLEPAYRLRHALKVSYLWGLIVAVTVVGVLMFAIWVARRHEPVYLWYTLTSLTFVVYSWGFATSRMPLPPVWCDWLYSVSVGSFVGAITIFALHLLDRREPRLARALAWILGLGAISMALLAALGPAQFHTWVARIWHSAVLAFGVYPVWLFVRETWRKSDARSFWIMASATSMLVGGAHDVMINNHLITPFNGNYLAYMVPLPITVFSWLLIRRFMVALELSESLSRELDQRVREKEAELARTYASLREAERQNVLSEERARIQRDMHDGVGGTLISALAGMEIKGDAESPAAEALRGALDDLRLTIYSLEGDTTALRTALGRLADRLRSRAEDVGMRVICDFSALPVDLSLPPGDTLQLLRIVQEAFTNTLKHAQAKHFRLSALAQADSERPGVEITMADDGRGFDPRRLPGDGYGLANLRARPQRLGGRMVLDSGPGGTRIALWLAV
jgi:signal transduction histidine kinase